jgi:hypothetical protein
MAKRLRAIRVKARRRCCPAAMAAAGPCGCDPVPPRRECWRHRRVARGSHPRGHKTQIPGAGFHPDAPVPPALEAGKGANLGGNLWLANHGDRVVVNRAALIPGYNPRRQDRRRGRAGKAEREGDRVWRRAAHPWRLGGGVRGSLLLRAAGDSCRNRRWRGMARSRRHSRGTSQRAVADRVGCRSCRRRDSSVAATSGRLPPEFHLRPLRRACFNRRGLAGRSDATLSRIRLCLRSRRCRPSPAPNAPPQKPKQCRQSRACSFTNAAAAAGCSGPSRAIAACSVPTVPSPARPSSKRSAAELVVPRCYPRALPASANPVKIPIMNGRRQGTGESWP